MEINPTLNFWGLRAPILLFLRTTVCSIAQIETTVLFGKADENFLGLIPSINELVDCKRSWQTLLAFGCLKKSNIIIWSQKYHIWKIQGKDMGTPDIWCHCFPVLLSAKHLRKRRQFMVHYLIELRVGISDKFCLPTIFFIILILANHQILLCFNFFICEIKRWSISMPKKVI